MTSNKVLSADNQQERPQLKINPWYISGFVDGEGSFHIAFHKDERMKTSLKVIPEFHVSQNKSSNIVLEEIRKKLDCGHIKTNHRLNPRDKTYVLVVRERNDLLKKVLPFFERYRLRTAKRKDFKLFAKIVRMINSGSHQNKNGLKRIIKLAYQMNNGGARRKVLQQDLFKIMESSETIREIRRRGGKI